MGGTEKATIYNVYHDRKEACHIGAIEHYHPGDVINILRHNAREIINRTTESYIDPERTHLNYRVSPDRGMTDREYYRQRRDELQYRKRKDLRIMSEVVIQAPKDLPASQHKEFFERTYDYYSGHFGEQNIIAAHVHMDETTPHVHIDIINAYQGRINAHEIWTRTYYTKMHPELQQYLADHGIHANILTGITKQQGRAYTVRELKAGVRDRDMAHARERANPWVEINRKRAQERTRERN